MKTSIPDQVQTFSEKFACPDCGISYPEISPRLFSFNNPYGACPECDGLGTKMYFDPDLIVPNPDLSIREGAIAPWAKRVSSAFFMEMLLSLARHYGFDVNTPWKKLPKKIKDVILYGSGRRTDRFLGQRRGPGVERPPAVRRDNPEPGPQVP